MKTTHSEKAESCFRGEIVIKTGKTVLFASVLALLVFFSYTGALYAHNYQGIPARAGTEDNHENGSVTAEDVMAGDKVKMRELVLHAKDHLTQLTDYRNGLAPFLRLIQEKDGDWQNDDVYIWRMSKEGVIQQPHPFYPLAQGGTLNNYSPMKNLMDELEKSEDGVACVDYTLNGEARAACAATVEPQLPALPPGPPPVLVAGLHHDFSDLSFSNLNCPHYVPKTSAVDVVDRDTLKEFVDEFVEFYVDLVDREGISYFVDALSCFRVLPWKNDSVYLFAMTSSGLVVFNGNTPSLENTNLNVVDDDGTNIRESIIDAVEGKAEREGEFVEYLWDDPTDGVDPVIEEGRAPGSVPKLSYVTSTALRSGGRVIWGSGIYPEQKNEDDGGCAVAGSGNAPGNGALNLLLIISMLFPAALWRKRSKGKTTMRKRTETGNGAGTLVVCALTALLVFFSAEHAATAHEGDHSDTVTAGEVTAGDEQNMREFVLHAKAHWEAIEGPNENIRFEKSLTVEEGGDWKNGTIYLMAIDEDGTIYTHAHDPDEQNGTLRHHSADNEELLEDVSMLVDKAEESDQGGCIQYEERVACSVKFRHPVWKTDLILLAGYHHDHEEHNETALSFDHLECPYFVSEIIDEEPYFKQGTTANKVSDSDTLKSFVREFKKHLSEQVEEAGQTPAKLATIRNCWRALPWKYGDVYLFIMTEEDHLVFFNGNSPGLENGTLDVEDANGCDVGAEAVRVARGEKRQCRGLGLVPEDSQGFLEYLWDDPTDSIDPVADEGMAPGDIPKLSYVEQISFTNFLDGENLIIGSGYHPEISDDADDGCLIAGSRGTVKGTPFSLLFAASVLLSAVFLRNRSAGK